MVGLAARPTALALAGNMVGAIATAGRVDGGVINLGLAPALLVAMLGLAWAGAGEHSLDEWLVSTRKAESLTRSMPRRHVDV